MTRSRLLPPLAESLSKSALDSIRESTERSRVALLISLRHASYDHSDGSKEVVAEKFTTFYP